MAFSALVGAGEAVQVVLRGDAGAVSEAVLHDLDVGSAGQ
jgi:hypothetical protein